MDLTPRSIDAYRVFHSRIVEQASNVCSTRVQQLVLPGAIRWTIVRVPSGEVILLFQHAADIAVDTKRNRVAVPFVDRNLVEIWQLPAK